MNRLTRALRRRSRGGVNSVIVILLVLIGIMLVIIALPKWDAFKERSQRIACEQALKSARDGLIIDYFDNWQSGSVEDAMDTLDEVMPARANICPSGGEVYLIRDANGIFEPVCGMHDEDAARRTRLNASRSMDLLDESLPKAKRKSGGEPEMVEIKINGQILEIVRVQEAPNIHRGTATTDGYDGIVAFYAVAGEGDFADIDAKEGTVCYFLYADEEHFATWQIDDGWTGDAYNQQ